MQVSTEETSETENDRDVAGYWVKDSFGLRNSPDQSKVDAMDFFLVDEVKDHTNELVNNSTLVNGIIGL